MPQGNRPGDQRRADATAARAKGVTTRAVGTTRGETTSGSRSNVRGGMGPIGSSQPPSMGLSQSAINNASFIDYRRTPGDTARETLDLGRLAGPSFNQRLDTYHRRLGEIDRRNVSDKYNAETNDIVYGHPFGKRPPVTKGSQNTTSPKSEPDQRSGRDLRTLARDTRAGHRGERGQNVVLDQLNEQNVRNANYTARGHEDSGKLIAGAHANAYYGRQTDRMRAMTGNYRQTGMPSSVNARNESRNTGLQATNSMPRPNGNKNGPATSESVARDLGDYAMRPLGKEFMPSDGRVAGAVKGAARGAAINGALRAGGLAAGAFIAGRAMEHGTPSSPQKTESQKMRDDASDMGPVKGRMMERRSYQAAAGTRLQDTKIVPYEGQGPISKKLGVSNVKAGNNR